MPFYPGSAKQPLMNQPMHGQNQTIPESSITLRDFITRSTGLLGNKQKNRLRPAAKVILFNNIHMFLIIGLDYKK